MAAIPSAPSVMGPTAVVGENGYRGGQMARPTVQIQELARIGSAARLKELAGEMEAIRRAFPDTQKTGKTPLLRGKAPKAGGRVPKKARKRSGWSAAARKAVGVRMKKYWAAKRKAKTA
jgi:hypothetical protein